MVSTLPCPWDKHTYTAVLCISSFARRLARQMSSSPRYVLLQCSFTRHQRWKRGYQRLDRLPDKEHIVVTPVRSPVDGSGVICWIGVNQTLEIFDLASPCGGPSIILVQSCVHRFPTSVSEIDENHQRTMPKPHQMAKGTKQKYVETNDD